MAYPKRERFHAHKLVRLLFKSCDVQTVGANAALLVVHIAHTEDAARYSGPVRFWNSQLQEVLGFRSSKQLPAARKAAVDAGWLVYQRKGTRSVGEYWTTVPDRFRELDDTVIEPVGELESMSGFVPPAEQIDKPIHSARGTNGASIHSSNGTNKSRIRSAGGTQSGTCCGTQSGTLSNPYPNPNPKNGFLPKSRLSGVGKKPEQYTPEFEAHWTIWAVTHRGRKNKADAFKAWWKAIALLRKVREDAVGWLTSRLEAFVASEEGKSEFSPHLSTWLNKRRWEADTAAWNKASQGENGKPEPSRPCDQVWSAAP